MVPLSAGRLTAGAHTFAWDGYAGGSRLPNGQYLLTLVGSANGTVYSNPSQTLIRAAAARCLRHPHRHDEPDAVDERQPERDLAQRRRHRRFDRAEVVVHRAPDRRREDPQGLHGRPFVDRDREELGRDHLDRQERRRRVCRGRRVHLPGSRARSRRQPGRARSSTSRSTGRCATSAARRRASTRRTATASSRRPGMSYTLTRSARATLEILQRQHGRPDGLPRPIAGRLARTAGRGTAGTPPASMCPAARTPSASAAIEHGRHDGRQPEASWSMRSARCSRRARRSPGQKLTVTVGARRSRLRVRAAHLARPRTAVGRDEDRDAPVVRGATG